ncbi:nitroreductase [Pseudarthrobacter defluvii]|uniref:nitroreductase family protein n=1 Tax=Pseudarthrobacter defluvii TaxID=410837 RepID=UPI00277FAF5A|nr:nitroreductase [Pseudarthrobacter defluvii]
MEFLEVVFNRKTTNGPFLPHKVSKEHQQLLMKVAAAAPSQFNSQPWRFVLIEEQETIDRIAEISGASMTKVMAEGTFFERHRKYFRFSRQEMDEQRSGTLRGRERIQGVWRPRPGKSGCRGPLAVTYNRTEKCAPPLN